jgi:hypothetical protein
MTKRSRRHNHNKFDCAPIILGLRLVDELNVEPGDAKDLHKAIAKIAPFFYAPFLESKDGKPFRNSLIFNQVERAKNFPDTRSHVSNKFRSPEFFKEVDKDKEMGITELELQDVPFEWDVHVRPTIAHRKCLCLQTTDQYLTAISVQVRCSSKQTRYRLYRSSLCRERTRSRQVSPFHRLPTQHPRYINAARSGQSPLHHSIQSHRQSLLPKASERTLRGPNPLERTPFLSPNGRLGQPPPNLVSGSHRQTL